MMMILALMSAIAISRVVAQTPAPTPFPTHAAECDASRPCESPDTDGSYCDYSFPSGEEGYCNRCLLAEDGKPYVNSCLGNGTEECIQNCFPTYKCSEEAPCSGQGQWCSFQLGDSGLCQDCTLLETHPGQCFLNIPLAGQEACKSTCFEACASNDDCEKGQFCTMETSDGGFCTECTGMEEEASPRFCWHDTYFFNWTKAGQEACLSRCFDPCEDSGDCEGFCNKLEGSSSGHCESCYYHSWDVLDCFSLMNDTTTASDCASVCFGECSIVEDRPVGCTTENNEFCEPTDGDAGYCRNCSHVFGVETCFGRNTTEEGKEHCARTCFGECSKANPCPDGRFCNFQNGEDGYCSPCKNLGHATNCMALSQTGQESCVRSCYGECSSNQTCPARVNFDAVFCDYQLDDTTGACARCPDESCNEWDMYDDNISLTPLGQESCTNTCFLPCTADSVEEDCGSDQFCTSDGYCMPIYDDGDTVTASKAMPIDDDGDTVTASKAPLIGVLLGVAITVSSLFCLV